MEEFRCNMGDEMINWFSVLDWFLTIIIAQLESRYVRVQEHLIICATGHIASLNYCQIQYIPYCLADEINDLSLKVELLSKKYDT